MEIINRPSKMLVILTWISQNADADEQNIFSFLLDEVVEHIRPEGYCEMWLPNYVEYDFFQLFRMSRTAFQQLNEQINRNRGINILNIGGGIPIPAEKRLMMLLWWLGKGETLLSVSDKFNTALSAIHKSNNLLLDEIISLQHTYIVWPNHNEMETVTNEFYRRGNIPG